MLFVVIVQPLNRGATHSNKREQKLSPNKFSQVILILIYVMLPTCNNAACTVGNAML